MAEGGVPAPCGVPARGAPGLANRARVRLGSGLRSARRGYKGHVLREGPIPRFVHGIIEYGAGVLLVIAPFVFAFDSGGATAVSIALGVIVIAIAASTDGPTSLINQIPLTAHVALDYVLAGLLIAMPFIASFSDETAPTAFFIALGVGHLLITIGTRFRKAASA
jgi:hypothetical protein